ncbi:MAG: YtrH family sporulation protein [Bacillota bacterium]
MNGLGQRLVIIFFTAGGVLLGAALAGALGAALTGQPSISTMLRLAREVKIWAIVAAIGGSFSTFEIFDSGLFHGEITAVVRQLLYVLASLAGAQSGYYLIMTLGGGNE